MHQIGIRHSNIPTSFCGEKGIPIQYSNEKIWRKGSEFPTRRPFFLEKGIPIQYSNEKTFFFFLVKGRNSHSQQEAIYFLRKETQFQTRRLFYWRKGSESPKFFCGEKGIRMPKKTFFFFGERDPNPNKFLWGEGGKLFFFGQKHSEIANQ